MPVLFTLHMEGMRFHAFHGSMEVDRELGQILDVSINLTYEAGSAEAGKPEHTYSYAEAYEMVQKVVMGTKYMTIEALALEISRKLFAACSMAEFLEVSIKRGQLYVPGVIGSAAVSLSVSREDLEE